MLKSIKLKLETITPLFLGGSEPRGEPELRPSSFKGELRFWWRALWGGVYPNRSFDELAEAESKIFGNTESAAPLVLRLADEPPKKETWKFGALPGVDYLFFSVKGNQKDPDRKGFSPQQTFELSLQTRAGAFDTATEADSVFRQACAALWLFVRFGGVGARSRRGAGNLHVRQVDGDWPADFPSLAIQARSAAEYSREQSDGLTKLYRALSWPLPTPGLKRWPEYDILHPDGGPLYVLGKEWNSWDASLNAVGIAYRDFRSRRQPDYSNVKDVVAGNTTNMQPVERAAFGLPIVFYYRSLGGQRGTLEGQEVDRRASPLIFHVARLGTGKFVVNFVRFNARLLPRGSGLKLKPRGRSASSSSPDGKLISEFLQSIGERGHKDKHGDFFIAPMFEITYPEQEATA